MELQISISASFLISIILTIVQSTNSFDSSNEKINRISKSNNVLVNDLSNSTLRCRHKSEMLLDEVLFNWQTCIECYTYMPDTLFYPGEKLTGGFGLGWLQNNKTNHEYFYGKKEDRLNITATFKSDKGLQLWKECCEAAIECCQQMNVEPERNKTDHPYCRRQWDGWQCIQDSLAGQTLEKIPCPSFIYFYSDPPTADCPYYARKECHTDGSWEFKTDYTSCGQAERLIRRMYVNIGAFAFSLVFLIPAVIIFSAYNQLRVPRVVMHTNLFMALILNGIVIVVFKSVIGFNALSEGSDFNSIVGRNSAECKFAYILTKYTRMATYMWMFCEGFYLHKLIVTAFAEEKRLILYYIIGWVFPVIPLSLYALMRKLYDDNQCWMTPAGNFEWINNAPMLLSLALNLCFLCNIIRALITKLNATTHLNEPSQYRKAVRATIVLVPVFGLHFLLTIYLPNKGSCEAIDFYYYLSHLLDGLQGFLVSLIFCYLNGEILTLLARSFNTFRMQQKLGSERSRTYTSTHEEAKDKVLHLLKRSYQRHRLLTDPNGHSRVSASTQMMSVTELPTSCGNNSFSMH